MKKKKFMLKGVLIVLILISGLFFYSQKVNKIEIIENIKNAMNSKIMLLSEQVKSNINLVTEKIDTTTIDVTNLEDNGNLEHEHLFKTLYNENTHWEECTICGERCNEISHSYTDNGWLYGSSCTEGNVHKYSCICGYSYTTNVGKPAHNMGTAVNTTYRYDLERACNNGCGYIEVIHRCKNSSGNINCGNLGRCQICGFNFTTSNSNHLVYATVYVSNSKYSPEIHEKDVYCQVCNTHLARVNYLKIIKKSITEYIYQAQITYSSGVYNDNIYNVDMLAGKHNVYNTVTSAGTTCTIERQIKFNEYLENGGPFQISFCGKKNGMIYQIAAIAYINKLDEIEPIISNITMEESEELTEWSRTKPITVSGIENYCKSVTVKIIDENENTVFEGKGSVNNPTDSNYAVSCIPELEVDTNGKTFKAIVTDACGNSTEKEFKIAKIDTIPPTPTSGTEILGDWAKSKDFTFSATDYGIGQVSIAFNDMEDLQLANVNENTYSRDYTFIGDVYTSKQLSVLYKDGLGNTSIQKITIDKLDNTAPMITNATLNSNKLIVEANDEHETLGEGSGVVKYKYLTSDKRLVNPEVTEDWKESSNNEIVIDEVYKAKYIYVVAEDLVGNVSDVYEIVMPELILDTEVDLSLSDGKGGVNLDWTGYDPTNKVFKAYHKKDDIAEADWEAILDNENTTKFTDNLAQDTKAPDAPTMSAGQVGITKDIQISFNTKDNGSTYSFYVEAYDSVDTSIKLSVSNERTETVTTGTKGYYYIIDEDSENKDFDITSPGVQYTTDENILIHIKNNGKYIHMKADDKAENVSEPSTYKIDLKIIDIDEEITIELTKTWIDNDIQRARRPDKLRFVVVPVKESDELKALSSNNNVSEVNATFSSVLPKEDSPQNNSEELNEEIIQGKTEQDDTIKGNIKPEESNKDSKSEETQPSSLNEEKVQEENSLEVLELENNKTEEKTCNNEVTNSRVDEKNTTNEILNKTNNVVNNTESKDIEKIENTVKSSELESIENITNSNRTEILAEENIVENETNKETNIQNDRVEEEIVENNANINSTIEDTKIEDKLETPKLDTTQVNNEITLEENPVDIEEGIESYTYEFEVDKTVSSQVFNLAGILKYDQTTGKPMKYIIKEEEVKEGDLKFYETIGGEVEKIADSEGNIIKYKAELVNRFKLPENNTKDIKVTKIWNDDNQITIRPTSVILELIGRVKDIQVIEQSEAIDNLNTKDENADEEKTVKIPKQEEQTDEIMSDDNNKFSYKTMSLKEGTVSAESEWKHIYTELPIYDEDGQEIEYIAQEKEGQAVLDKYISETSKINEANEITVTNNLIIRNSNMTKTGPDEITSIDSNVPYNINYEVELDNKYTENMVIEIVDTLPYQIEKEKSNLKGGIYNYNEGTKVATITWKGTYNPVSKTITWENSTEENNSEIEETLINLEVTENTEKKTQTLKLHIAINVTYKNINVLNEKIVNKVSGKITLSNNVEEKVESTFETRTRWIRNIAVTKLWKGDTEGTRPESIELLLLANTKDENNTETEYKLDESIETTKTLSKDTDWTGTLWTNLPSYDESGKEIHYTVKETDIDGYKSEILEINKNLSDIEITIQNTKLYKLPITGGIGVDTIRSLEVLVGIILIIILTNRKKIVPSRRSVVNAKRTKKLERLAQKYNNK